MDRNSAIIGDAFEKKSSIYATHQDMCRFSGPTCDGYQKILASIQEFITPASSSGSAAEDSQDKGMTVIRTASPHTQSGRESPGKPFSEVPYGFGFDQALAGPASKSGRLGRPSHASEPMEEVSVSSKAEPNPPPRKLRARLQEKDGEQMLSVFFEDRCLNIRFHRTIRIPDDDQTYNLPASLGTFPLFNVTDYTNTLPQDVVEKGGFFLPMYRK